MLARDVLKFDEVAVGIDGTVLISAYNQIFVALAQVCILQFRKVRLEISLRQVDKLRQCINLNRTQNRLVVFQNYVSIG